MRHLEPYHITMLITIIMVYHFLHWNNKMYMECANTN